MVEAGQYQTKLGIKPRAVCQNTTFDIATPFLKDFNISRRLSFMTNKVGGTTHGLREGLVLAGHGDEEVNGIG